MNTYLPPWAATTLLGALALVACTAPINPHPHLVIDSSFSQAEQDGIMKAIGEWMVVTDARVYENPRGSHGDIGLGYMPRSIEIKRASRGEHGHVVDAGDDVCDKSPTRDGVLGCWTWAVRVGDSTVDWFEVGTAEGHFAFADNKYAIMLHEIGHSLGVHHSDVKDDPLSFMSKVTTPKTRWCIEARVLNIVCKNIGCGPDAKPSCETGDEVEDE